ncbi:hypothetical protein BASA50_008138 [Batrachochytrium salamandrivorans]|uniref:Uncharacterized protein n=1 Tax=Batrachochytrium salamandrivorans TaxID=1357716 RepID=A0ABQ8F519_9FUNG|nr:hypothetical protein BASA50_008138 [Batrachochytrium salamandrivorans]
MKVAAATILSLIAVSAYASPVAYSASQEVSTDGSTTVSSADVYLEKRGGGIHGYSQGAGRVHDPPFNDGHRRSHVTGGHQQHPQNHNPPRLYGPNQWRHPSSPRRLGPYEELRHNQQQQRQQQQQYQQYLQYLQQQQYQRQYRSNRGPSGSYGNPRHTHQQYQVKQGTSNPSETSQHTQSAGSNVETKSEGGNNASKDGTETEDNVESKSEQQVVGFEDGNDASEGDLETGNDVGSKSEVSKPEGEANTNLEFVFADLEAKVAKIQDKVAGFKAKVTGFKYEYQVAESKDEGSSSEVDPETGNDVGAKPEAQVVESGDNVSEAPPSGLLQRLVGTARSFVCEQSSWTCGQDTKEPSKQSEDEQTTDLDTKEPSKQSEDEYIVGEDGSKVLKY